MVIRLEDGHLIVRETHKSSRGGDYTYVVRDSKLTHISRFFRPSKKEDRNITYEISTKDAEKILGQEIELIEFSFSNRGHFYPKIYRINLQTKTLNQEFSRNREVLGRYEFEILGDEYHALKEYEREVPPLIERVWEIEKRLNLTIHIRGTRGEEVHEDPELGKFNSLVFPNPRSRTRSLKEKIRFAHELYVLMLVVDSMLDTSEKERTLWVTHEDDPTLIIPSDPPLTIWYQFSIEEWLEVVKKGVIALFTGRKIRRSHPKPDILIFKGEYHLREDLLRNPPDSVILIDAKVELPKSDIEQLKSYKELFSRAFKNTEFIVAAIEKIPAHYKYKLEDEGYRVIENVFPGRSGEKEFQEVLQNIIEMWE